MIQPLIIIILITKIMFQHLNHL